MRALTIATGALFSLLTACGSPPQPETPEAPDPPPAEPPPAEPLEVAGPGPDCPEAQQTEAGACAIELDSSKESSSSVASEPATAAAPRSDPRDPRVAKLRPRERSMLISEIQALETLFRNTSKTSPDRPTLIHRLAEGYVELGYAAEKDADGGKLAKAARKKALAYYTMLKVVYPSHPRLEEVLYYAGYEHERAGDLAKARGLYRELATKFPNSPFLGRIPASVFKP